MRSLTLNKETLAELTVDDLRLVAGADSGTTQTRVYTVCTDPLSLGCQSWHTEEC